MPDLRALALEQRVGGHGGAVHDELGVGEQAGQVGAELDGQQREAVHHADGRIGGRGGRLGEAHAPVVVHGDQIGERAADVDADAAHVRPSARRGFAVTKPLTTVGGARLGGAARGRAVAAAAHGLDEKTAPGGIGMPTSLVFSTRVLPRESIR